MKKRIAALLLAALMLTGILASCVNRKPMRVRTNGTNTRSTSPAASGRKSLRSTSRMNSTIARAIATHAPRDIVNRQAKHMLNAATHARILYFGFST